MSIDNKLAASRPAFGRARTSPAAPSQPRAAQPRAPSSPRAPAAADDDPAFSMMRVITRALGASGRNAVTFAALLAAAVAPERALSLLMNADSPFAGSLSSIATSLCSILLQGALTRGAFDSFAGEPVTLGRCLDTGLKSFLALFAIGLLSALSVGAFALLLVVPGIWLALGWSVVVPVRIAEGTAIGASFARSTELTRGYRWQILGLGVMLVVLLLLVGALMAPFWGISLAHLGLFLLDNWLVRPLLAAITALCLASLYHELRLAKEDGTAQETRCA